MTTETIYTILANSETQVPSINELRNSLEKGGDLEKVTAMKQIINLILNGENCDSLLMHIIRFIMPSKNKQLKKLLHFYWEVCTKYDEEGKLKQEMILVCNAIRNDLQHPNEFIRGATLRFLCKLREPELLEPLIPSCRACLEHRLSYVRKNAITAIHSIYKYHPNLLPDAPELLQSFLVAEPDATCKRNAFIMLSNLASDLASDFIKQNADNISTFDELLQLAILEHIRKVVFENINEKPKYIQIVVELLTAQSPSVKYEAATSLPLLSSNSVAIKASASCFLELALKESDNNVKLIVLDRFESLSIKNNGMFFDLVMDVLRILTSSPDIDVRKKVLQITNQLVSKRNVNDVVKFLQKELTNTHDQQYEKNNEYRELLIHTIHTCAIRFPIVASKVINVLIEFLSENNNNAAVDVISFIREVAEKFPDLRSSILNNLLSSFLEIKTSRALRGALWVIGEYSNDLDVVESAWQKIRLSLGDIPMVAAEQLQLEKLQDQSSEVENKEQSYTSSQRRVNADGTYATESSFTTANNNNLEQLKSTPRPPIRTLLMKGDYFIGSVLASSLTKLVLKYKELSKDSIQFNSKRAEAMLIMTSIIRLGQSQFTYSMIDNDNLDRIMDSIKLLAKLDSNKQLHVAYLNDGQKAYSNILNNKQQKELVNQHLELKVNKIEVDDKVEFKLLSNNNNTNDNQFELDLNKATGELINYHASYVTKLDNIVPLSGFSDAIYSEAIIEINQYDILLEILLVNMTEETLQNVNIELSTLGDVKLIEKPNQITLAPNAFHSTRASFKVSSTETGVIFGNLNYDLSKSTEGTNSILLNDIHIDIMDYIQPSNINLNQFRTMWTEFEWENKVNINHKGPITLIEFLNKICKATNMLPLSKFNDNSQNQCGFLSTNLYAKTIFGEDALANLSVELKEEQDCIVGHIRIRSKAQGLALALGDKVTLAVKK